MDEIMKYLPLLIPYVVAELILAIVALIHVLKHSRYRFGNRIMWVVIVLIIQIIGPVAYFIFGREEE